MYFYKLFIFSTPLNAFTYKSENQLQPRDIVHVEFSKKIKKAIISEEVSRPEFECKDIVEQIGSISQELFLLIKFISNYYVCSLGEASSLVNVYTTTKKLAPYKQLKTCSLSPLQSEAKKELKTHPHALLFGDTGSGKTEIYISLMQDVLSEGKNVIFLMPEISLTPQMKKRLEEYFGSHIALWHSKITKKAKEKIIQGLEDGSVRIVAGARSALFLPISNVGLIVVDEEHDESYKSSSNPRYNARDLALVYGKILNSHVVLGSATPSVTSFHKLPHVRVKGTYFKSKKEFIYEDGQNEITPFLLHHIEKNLAQKKQAIIFVPTRANFKYLTCKSCGASVECPFCAVSMSLHRDKNLLRCHYCNYATPIPQECPVCGEDMLEATRIGTVEVADILKEHFANAAIEIFDKDAVSTQRKLNKTLKDFNDGNIDILVGTQMLSKGHDYHDVSLSVVLGIDALLNQPDFKAREKALSLAIQIAGRSGRKGSGKVLIQTKQEEFFSLYMEDYDAFLSTETPMREGLYPPFMRLLRVLISHKKELIAQDITASLVKKIQNANLAVEIVGSGRSNITKISNLFRYEILLRSDKAKPLIQCAMLCKEPNVQIDMDPLSFS